MAARYPATCRCTMRRVAEPNQGIWVTDSMLRVAIERYQGSCHPPRRHISSHRGAMESRRRMGGRNMTLGMGVAPHTPPSWYFDVMQSNTWQWEAPTAPEQRKTAKQDLSIPAMYTRFRTWLEQSDAGQAFIQPPADLSATEARFATADTSLPAAADSSETQEASGYNRGSSPPLEIEQLRMKLASLSVPRDGAVIKLCKQCGQSLTQRINSGELSTNEIIIALNPLDVSTRQLLANTNLVDRATSIIRREVLYGMHLAEKAGSNLVSKMVWKEMVTYLSDASFFTRPGSISFFILLLRAVPVEYRSLIEGNHVFSAVRAIVQSAQALDNGDAKMSALRAAKVASALGRLGETQWVELSEHMDAYLDTLIAPVSERYKMRRMWLFIQAHSPFTTNESFESLHKSFVGTETQGFHKSNTWLFLLARLTANGHITRQDRAALYDNFSQASHDSVALLRLLHTSERRQTGLDELYALTVTMNARNSILQSIENTTLKAADIDAIRDLAMQCNDASFALKAWEATLRSADAELLAKQWKWTAWTPYLAAITQDQQLDSYFRYMITRTSALQKAEDVQSNMDFLDIMAKQYTSLTTLSERQKLRRLEACAARQRRIAGVVSFDILRMIAMHVTDDLQHGQLGRTARLEWLVRLIDEMLGPEQAAESLKALRGWRWMISGSSGRD